MYNVYNPCEDDVVDPVCDPCLDDVELGRVRGVAFIHASYVDAVQADPENPTVWQDGIDSGVIKVIPATTGSYDGGAPVEVPGYGDVETKVIGFKMGGTYKDPVLLGNTAFYNSMRKSSKYHIAFRTETLTRISENPVTVLPSAPVEEDLSSHVVWNVAFKFSQKDHPVPFVTPEGVFEC